MAPRALPDLIGRVRYLVDKDSIGEAGAAADGLKLKLETLSTQDIKVRTDQLNLALAKDKALLAELKAQAADGVEVGVRSSAVKGDMAQLQAQLAALKVQQMELANLPPVDGVSKFEKVGTAAMRGVAGEARVTTAAMEGVGAAGIGLNAATLAPLAIAAGMTYAAVETAKMSGEVRQFQAISGQSAEDASAMVSAFKTLGVAPEEASKTFTILERNIQKNHAQLAQYGVEVKHAKDGTVDMEGTLESLSDAYVKAADGPDRTQLSFLAMGRSASTMIPVLSEGGAKLKALFADAREHGVIFSQEELDNMKQAEVNARLAHEAWDGFLKFVGDRAAAVFNDQWKEVRKVGEVWRELSHGDFGSLNPNAAAADKHIQDSIKAEDDLRKGILGRTAADQAAILAENERSAALNAEAQATLGLAGAEKTLDAAQRAVTDSTEQIAKARTDLADAQAGTLSEVDRIRQERTEYDRSAAAAERVLAEKKKAYDLNAEARIREANAGIKEEEEAIRILELTQQTTDLKKQISTDQADESTAIAEGDLLKAGQAHTKLEHDKRQQVIDTAKAALDAHKETASDAVAKIQDEKRAEDQAYDARVQQIRDFTTLKDQAFAAAEAQAQKAATQAAQIATAQDHLNKLLGDQAQLYRNVADAMAAVDKQAAEAKGQPFSTQDVLASTQAHLQDVVKTIPAGDLHDEVVAILEQLRHPGAEAAVPGAGKFQARASGGPVARGVPYLRNEQGPELFIPDVNGRIVDATTSARMAAGGAQGGAGGQVPVNLTINTLGDMRAIHDAVYTALAELGIAS